MKARTYTWEKTAAGKEWRSQWDKQRVAVRKSRAIEYLGGKCAQCGSVDALEFDHIDSKNVGFRIAKKYTIRWEVLQLELDKCQLLCGLCHIAKTAKEFRAKHKTAWGNYVCTCASCVSSQRPE